MKTITKFIFGFPMLALACGSIALAQNQFAPLTPADSAAKAAAAAQREAAVGGSPTPSPIPQMVEFDSGSRWHLNVQAVHQFGLVITGASFQKAPGTPFIYVLFDGRLGEIFVPYHSGSPRYGDISGTGGASTYDPMPLTRAQFPPPRQILPGGKICKEKREYLAWINSIETFRDPSKPAVVRNGQEVVYFSVLMAANYAYIMEWTFRDDGTILVRAGSTGPKAFNFPKEGHMHDFTWRLDIDLNGANANRAYLSRHLENLTPQSGTPSTARDIQDLISFEGSRFWKPQNFNSLQIYDRTLKNGNDRETYYELVPMRSGTARHSEAYTQKDFWVTRYDPQQSFIAEGLPNYIANRQPTVDKDLVIWYTGSEHHEGTGVSGQGDGSRDEDKNTVPVLWTGFELIPNNLFDGTPFYPTPTPTP